MNISEQTDLRRVLSLAGFLAAMIMLPATAQAMDLNNGKRLYDAHCAGCHGLNGHSVMPKAPNFARGEQLSRPDFDLVNIIKNGSPTHPPFFGIMAEREMFDLVGYMRNLR